MKATNAPKTLHVFTPRKNMVSKSRVTMQLDDADDAKIGTGSPWRATVTDRKTGRRYQVRGCRCEASKQCFCDAVIVKQLAKEA